MQPVMAKPLARRERPAWTTTALVIAVSLVIGVAVLPRIRPSEARIVGQAAPDFVLPVVHGGDAGSRIRLSNLKSRTVVLEFWASWCSACARQMPILNELVGRLPSDEVAVVGISVDDSPEPATQVARARALRYPSVHDSGGHVAESYGASTLPTMVVIDRDGRVRAVRHGVVGAPALEGILEEVSARGTRSP
jgi:cytochrome c biogenesis protein CcmG/thiol:disulfide interchange protein DsbE